MAIFAENFLFRARIELQYRVLLIPWMRKNSSISCSKARDYSSSFPVKYIPKKSSKTQELHPSPPMKILKDKEKRNISDPKVLKAEFSGGGKSSRRSFILDTKSYNQNQRPINNLTFEGESGMEEEIDHELGFEDYGIMEEPEEVVEELGTHQATDSKKQLAIPDANTKQDVEKFAIELLAVRGFTAVELRKKLHGKKFPLDIINAVIMDFQRRGLINDYLYAETYCRSRWSSSSWGPRRIKQALFKKGVSEIDAEKAIEFVFRDGETDDDRESRLELSNLSLDHLFIQASKQWLRGREEPREKRKSRIIRWLQYRGFNWGVINCVLKKLESKYPP